MKFFSKVSLIALLAISAAACGRVTPNAGHEVVLTRQPMFFGHGGVDETPIKTGSTYVAWTTHADDVVMQPQAFEIKYDDMMSGDGVPLSFHATLTLQVTDSVALVKKFSGGADLISGDPAWYVHNILPVENNYVRDAFKGHTMIELAIETKGTNAVESDVKKRLEEYIKEKGIPAVVVNFSLGKVNPPREIKSQRTKTAEEQQRQQTELQTKIAEDNRKMAETARAAADDAYRQAMGLSPEQFVELQRIQMQNNVCKDQHCTMIIGAAQPLINTK